MGTYYHARALEWFEVARSELSRVMGVPYTEWEQRKVYTPIIEAHLRFQGRAQYDDELLMSIHAEIIGHTRLKFLNTVVQAESGCKVCNGHTIHAIVGQDGRPMRIPEWIRSLFPLDACSGG